MKTRKIISFFIISSIILFNKNLFGTQLNNFDNYVTDIQFFNSMAKLNFNYQKNLTINDSTCEKKNFYFYKYDNEFNKLNRLNIDSLMKNFRNKLEFEKYFKEDFLNQFDENISKLWKNFPKLDKEQLDNLLKEFNKNFNKDSLFKKFKYFNRKNLFHQDELIEI